jgi:acyl-CoA thioester hydrolase
VSPTEVLLAQFPVVVRQPVQWGDMDYYRHVNNVVYFRYFENARLAYFERLDWPAYERVSSIGPILAATTARFRRALTWPDNIAIGARATEIGVDRFTLEHLIVSEAQQTVVTEGTGLVVTYHYGEGRKVAIPEEVRRRIEVLERRG